MLIAMQSVALMAQEARPQLVVWLKGGEKAYFDLDKLPETSFGDGLLTIKSSTSTVSYQLANVLRYTYLNVQSTGIDDMPSAYINYFNMLCKVKVNKTLILLLCIQIIILFDYGREMPAGFPRLSGAAVKLVCHTDFPV